MVADWRSSIGGVAGSGAVHLLAVLWLVAALFGGPIREAGWRTDGPLRSFAIGHADPAFTPVPRLFAHDHILIVNGADCGGNAGMPPPRMLGSGVFAEPRPMVRAPRICVRIEPNGRVTAARVLRSSGHRWTDRAMEAHARALVFAPASPGTRAITATLDVTGGRTATPTAARAIDLPPLPPL